jgi:hypothetical protein
MWTLLMFEAFLRNCMGVEEVRPLAAA